MILIAVVVLIVLLAILVVFAPKAPAFKKAQAMPGKCSASCNALEPVNEPDYNVQEAIKQVLLLEQHLAEKAKYCKSCITKHFLLVEGLLSEAVWMSCKRCSEYPKLEESVEFFKKLFKEWHEKMDDEKTRLEVLDKLRQWRREMVDLYYFEPGKSDSHS